MENKYVFNGHEVTVIVPENPAEGRPWVWRAEFLYDFNYIDMDLLKKGWHIAYCKLSDMFGCPEAVEEMKKFHDDIIERYNLSAKADIFGFSRGGLYASNYTLKYPEDISTLYLDAPVLDIRSWPGGKGKGNGNPTNWKMCLDWYGITDEESKNFTGCPIHHIDELIATKVPVLLIAGDVDESVPYDENGMILNEKYEMCGAKILTIVKPGCGHHPHSVEDTTIPVRYIMDNRK